MMVKPAETVEEMFWRVAYHVAKVEEQWEHRCSEAYRRILPFTFKQSPEFTHRLPGAGTPLGQLAACFVLPLTIWGRDSAGICILRDAALDPAR